MANEALILSVTADIQTAINNFRTLDTTIANIKKQAKDAKDALGSINTAVKASTQAAQRQSKSGVDPALLASIKQQEAAWKRMAQAKAIEAKEFAASEKAKQKAIEATRKAQEKAAQQQAKEKQSFTNRLLGGIAPGLGAGAAVAGVMALQGAVQNLGQAMQRGIDFNAYLEANTAMFGIILKDGPKATQLLADLQKEALKTSLNFKEAVVSSKQLLAYGFDLKSIIPTMRMLGTVTSATGGNLDDLAYVYGTLKTQGRAYTRDLMQFAMRGIPIYENLAKVMGVPVNKIKEMTEAGVIGFAEVEKAFQRMTTDGGVYAGAMEARMQTFVGMTETLEKKTDILLGKSAKLIEGMSKGIVGVITGAVDILIETVDRYQWIVDESTGENKRTEIQSNIQKAPSRLYKQADLDTYIKNESTLNAGSLAMRGGKALYTSIEEGLAIVEVHAKKTGATQLEIAEAMWRNGVVVKGVWEQVFDEAENTAQVLRDSFKIVTSDLLTLTKRLGVSSKTATTSDASSYVTGRQSFRGSLGILDVANTRRATDTQLAKAKELNLPDEITKKIADDFNSGVIDRINVAMETLKDETITKSQRTEIETYIKGLKPLMFPEDKKGRALSPDPKLYEKMLSEGSFSEVDNIQLEYIQSLASLTKAYQDAGITGDLLTKAQGLLATQFEIRAKAAQARSASTGSSDEVFAQIQRVQGLIAQRDSARNVATGARTIMESTGGYKEGGNNTTFFVFKKMMEDAEASLSNFTIEVDKAQEELGRLTTGVLSQFQELTLTDLQAQIAAVGGSPEGQIASMASAHALEMENKRIEHDTSIKLAQASFDEMVKAGNTSEATKMQADMDYMRRKYNLEVDLAKKLSDEQIKQVKRQADLQKFEEGIGGKASFWEDVKIQAINAFKGNNNLSGVGQMAVGATQGTDTGAMLSGANPIMAVTDQFLKLVVSVENVQKTFNFIGTTLTEVFAVIGPLINTVFEPFVYVFQMLGEVIGQVLSPFIAIGKTISALLYVGLVPFIAILQMVGKAFETLSDFVIDYFINPLIRGINFFIDGINGAFGWAGVHIKKLGEIANSAARRLAELDKEKASDLLKRFTDALGEAISYLRNRITELADKMITSAQDLFDVGAISAAEYANRFGQAQDIKNQVDPSYQLLKEFFPNILDTNLNLTQLMEYYKKFNEVNEDWQRKTEEEKLASLNTIISLMKQFGATGQAVSGVTGTVGGYAAALAERQAEYDKKVASYEPIRAFGNKYASDPGPLGSTGKAYLQLYKHLVDALGPRPSFAVGTANVPKNMVANIHKGEGIVSEPIMSSIRSGDLTLSGPSGNNRGSGDTYHITVQVRGSVTTENDLAEGIADILFYKRKLGALTR